MTVPEKRLEASDPYEFTAARFPVDDPLEADREMARTFIEEYALMGFSRERVLQLFAQPIYAGTHDLYLRRGEAFVLELIELVFGPAASTQSALGEGK